MQIDKKKIQEILMAKRKEQREKRVAKATKQTLFTEDSFVGKCNFNYNTYLKRYKGAAFTSADLREMAYVLSQMTKRKIDVADIIEEQGVNDDNSN